MANLVRLWDVVVSLDLGSMRTHSKLLEGDPKGMHPVSMCILRSDDWALSHIKEVLRVEIHLFY